MEKQDFEERLKSIVPDEMKDLDVYRELEVRITLISLLELLKENMPDLYAKFTLIRVRREDEVVSRIKEMDLEAMVSDLKKKTFEINDTLD